MTKQEITLNILLKLLDKSDKGIKMDIWDEVSLNISPKKIANFYNDVYDNIVIEKENN